MIRGFLRGMDTSMYFSAPFTEANDWFASLKRLLLKERLTPKRVRIFLSGANPFGNRHKLKWQS